jgi:hypothetical protein
MNTQEINKRFAELAGICWHEKDGGIYPFRFPCKKCGEIVEWQDAYPNFCADPRLVLEAMMKREDWYYFVGRTKYGFLLSLFRYHQEDTEGAVYSMLKEYILDTTGKLAIAAIAWLEAKTS